MTEIRLNIINCQTSSSSYSSCLLIINTYILSGEVRVEKREKNFVFNDLKGFTMARTV